MNDLNLYESYKKRTDDEVQKVCDTINKINEDNIVYGYEIILESDTGWLVFDKNTKNGINTYNDYIYDCILSFNAKTLESILELLCEMECYNDTECEFLNEYRKHKEYVDLNKKIDTVKVSSKKLHKV